MKRVLDKAQLRELEDLYTNDKYGYREMARYFGVSTKIIKYIKDEKYRKNITEINKKWQKENREKVLESNRKYQKKRYYEDKEFRERRLSYNKAYYLKKKI